MIEPKRDWKSRGRGLPAAKLAGALVTATILLAGFAALWGQVPGQSPSPPPLHIPHLGGSRQERPQPEASTEGPVYVVFWFDTEDYILPQSDDAAKRIAVFLTQEGIPATFKVVGEKARVLQRRGRQDVISALARQDIGYHSNTHSQHPTVAEYEANLDWDAGVEEFNRRERPGFDDVAHIFGKAPVAYGQPGSSWAPQVFPALAKWSVRVYLDDGKQVGLRGRPFWYGRLLNIFNIRDGGQLRPNADWSNLDEAKQRFQDTYLNLTARKNGGVVSVCFHPCEFVHKEFWDAVNFRDGANPPPDQWKLPAVKTPEDTEKAFQYFEDLVRFIKSFPRVQFLTASGAAATFRDPAHMHVFSLQEVGAIAGQVDSDVSFQVGDGFDLSASEVFYVINRFLGGIAQRQGAEPLILEKTPYGPTSAAQALTSKLDAPWADVRQALLQVQDDLDKTGRIPDVIHVGKQLVPPESYLVGIARVAQNIMQKPEFPNNVSFGPARLAAADYVADDSPDLWDWIIFPKGFHAPKLMALAKLQAWTLKPASR